MILDLSIIPDGWFLHGLHNQIVPIDPQKPHPVFRCKEYAHPWFAGIQHAGTGQTSIGLGGTASDALEDAVTNARESWPELAGA